MHKGFAERHDASIQGTFRAVFGIPEESAWNVNLHKLAFNTWVRQSQLPLRLGGCGLRNSGRTSSAAYWASWADSVQGMCQRFPVVGSRILFHMIAIQAAAIPIAAPCCIMQAELAGTWCEAQGWTARPTWVDLVAGVRPARIDHSEAELGEWRHGWQYFASDAAEQLELTSLRQVMALPSIRSNAACTGKARLQSCTGRFASAWMVVAPTSDALTFTNVEMQIAGGLAWRSRLRGPMRTGMPA